MKRQRQKKRIGEWLILFGAIVTAISYGNGMTKAVLVPLFTVWTTIGLIIISLDYYKQYRGERDARFRDLEAMNGGDFERYIADLFTRLGYHVETTDTFGLFLLTKQTEKVALIVKRYTKAIDVRAIQDGPEVKRRFETNEVWVLANRDFTKPAWRYANSQQMRLIDRAEWVHLILATKKAA